MHVEGAQRVFVVRRHEDRERHGVAHFGDDAEAVEIGDLQVEEDQVGTQLANGVHRVQARVGRADHLDVGLGLQQLDDQSANPRHATPSTAAGDVKCVGARASVPRSRHDYGWSVAGPIDFGGTNRVGPVLRLAW